MGERSTIVANAARYLRDRSSDMLQRFFPGGYGSTKHDYAKDYGWPDQLGFDQFYRMYCRSGIAASAVDKTIGKTWQTMPALWESEKPKQSPAEKAIASHFTKRKIWRSLMDADRRSMVGCYAGAIILLADGERLEAPVASIPRGLDGLVGIIPAWEGQLTPTDFDQVETSPTYGEPLFYQFNEQAVGSANTSARSNVRIHRDRVLIFSDDGTLNCNSTLEPGFNDLIDAEKIKGAGGEGFWKSARGAPFIESKEGVTPQDMVRGMGLDSVEQLKEALDNKVADYSAGFDSMLMLGGFTAKPMSVTLPQPKEFWEMCAQGFAASMSIPVKVLIGNVTGERASTEDANEWAQTNMSRRENRVLPILHEFIDRLVRWGVLEAKDWTIGWQDLTEASPDSKLDRAVKMSTINKDAGTEPVFLPDEIRDEAGFKSAHEVEGFAEFLEQRRQDAEDAPTQTIPQEVQP